MKKIINRKKLSDLCLIQSGGTPSRGNYAYWNNGTIPWVKISDMKGKYVEDIEEKITIEGLENSAAKLFPEDTVLFSIFATLGEVAILKKRASCNQAIAGIQIKDNTVNLNYLYYCLLSFKPYVKFLGRGVAQSNINLSMLKNFEIPLPPLDIQKQIAMRLDKIQELVSLQKEQIRKLEQLVKSRFMEMFGDPITNPKGWKVKSLATVSPIDSKKTLHSNDTSWLLNLDKIESNTGRIIKKDIVPVSQIGNSVYCFQKGQVLYSKLRPYLNKVVLADEDGFCTSELLPLKPKEELCAVFLLFLLRSKSIVNFLSNKVAGAKMPRVDMGTFKSMPIVLPPLSLQKQFAEFVEKAETQKALLEKRLNRLETLYKSLMQEYFG